MGSWVLRALLVLSLAGLLSRSSTSVPAKAHPGSSASRGRLGDPWGPLPCPHSRLSMLGCQWTWSSWLLMETPFLPSSRSAGGQGLGTRVPACPEGKMKAIPVGERVSRETQLRRFRKKPSSSCSQAGGRAWSRPCPSLSPGSLVAALPCLPTQLSCCYSLVTFFLQRCRC